MGGGPMEMMRGSASSDSFGKHGTFAIDAILIDDFTEPQALVGITKTAQPYHFSSTTSATTIFLTIFLSSTSYLSRKAFPQPPQA